MWFQTLTGFEEHSSEQVRKNLSLNGDVLTSRVNGNEFVCGSLEIPTLAELRNRVLLSEGYTGKLTIREVIADVQHLHVNKTNAGSLFQVASQFNLLEMISPEITPEQGISGYEYDRTQGPACAVAAGSGTIYRNYFVPINGQMGQSADHQIDCLDEVGKALGNTKNRLWVMKNGYALLSEKGLKEISKQLLSSSESERDELRKLLRIGIQWHTEVTISKTRHKVTQAYCSALPVSYLHYSTELWTEFAQLILEATYEATICTGILNSIQNGNNKVYLTLIGGGAFGNKQEWIINAIQRSLNLYKHAALDVAIVCYGQSKKSIKQLIDQFES